MTVSFVCLDCETGVLNRYDRMPNRLPKRVKTGRFLDWNPSGRDGAVWVKVKDQIEEFRTVVIQPVCRLIPKNSPPSAA